MKRFFLQQPGYRYLLGLMLVAVLFFAGANNTYAAFDKPEVPYLSLTGTDGGYDDDWYPDGRIWLPVASNGPREFLLPVWIENRWFTYEENKERFEADPIYSFQFSMLYDSSAIRAVGVQKFGPRDEDLGYSPLSKDFNISWYDARDTSRYKTYLNDNVPWIDKQKGRVIRIVGTSTSSPLPHTDLKSREWKVLLYIRFRVMPQVNQPLGEAGNTPIIIANDTIKYNDWNIREDNPFQNLYKLGVPGVEIYEPNEFTGLGGINNEEYSIYDIEPHKEGVIYLRITDQLPEFEFKLERGIGSIPALRMVSDELWEMVDPITIDSAQWDPLWGRRTIQVDNGVSLTRLLDIEIETDQPWLKLQARLSGPSDKIPPDFSSPTRTGKINWLDNGILGDNRDPFEEPTDPDGDLQLEVQCDPNELDFGSGGEMAGKYIGYITFKSSTAKFNPVRMKITFIYFRNPIEWNDQNLRPGIELTVRNSRGIIGDSCKLVFGTGHRATDGIDSLFGEFAYEFPLEGFGARFYPFNNPDLEQVIPFGFGDWNPNDENAETTVLGINANKRAGSRDIRSSFDTLQSIYYYVKFNVDSVKDYPVIIEWSTKNFPDGAQLYLRDALNGSHFNVNMREANPLGNDRYSYIIQDPKWSDFLIEYTLPKVIRYVDREGNPIIQPGWNLLSMAVRPTNAEYDVFYPNGMNIPIRFTRAIYQPEELLRPGVGYFIRYPEEIVDTTFAGTFISRITKETGDPIRLYTGWNTIGALSAPLPVSEVELDPFDLNNRPDDDVTRRKGFYGYVTNRGYKPVATLETGRGYWMYVNKGAWLNLQLPDNPKIGLVDSYSNKDEIIGRSAEIVLRDNAQNVGNVYISNENNIDMTQFELPPTPPYGLFDVRFNNGAYIQNSNSAVVLAQGVTYPVSISINNPDANYTVMDAATGEVYGTITKSLGNDVVIPFSKSGAFQIVKGSELAFGNYPNPVVTSSTLIYAIPADGHVTINMYDAMGNLVKTLVDSPRNAGEHSVVIEAAELNSGSYTCRLNAGNYTAVRKITVVR